MKGKSGRKAYKKSANKGITDAATEKEPLIFVIL